MPMGSSRSAASCRSPIHLSRARRAAAGLDTPVDAGAAGRRPEARGRARIRRELRGLRRAQGLAADDAGRLSGRPLHSRAVDARDGLSRGDPGQPVRTTISDKAAPCHLNHVNRRFYAPAPNMLWMSDFTYVATWAGFVYVAFVIDTYARRIVGWRASRTAHASFVLDALEQALHDRRPAHRGGLIHHSDRGSQYVSIKYTERLAEAGIEPSVGSVGDSYDCDYVAAA
jgi:transposase InsO family protein